MLAAGTQVYFNMEERRTCSVNYFCFGGILIFLGSILFCALGFTIVLPYEATKHWYNTSCTVISADINESVCACDDQKTGYPGCSESYPCLQVYIAYKKIPVENFTRNHEDFNGQKIVNTSFIRMTENKKKYPQDLIELGLDKHRYFSRHRHHKNHTHKHVRMPTGNYYNAAPAVDSSAKTAFNGSNTVADNKHRALLYRSWTDIVYLYCTLQECGDHEWNSKETRRFKLEWGEKGSTFPCFVNPHDPNMVILHKTSFCSMLNAVVWPSACLFVGITLWLGLCLGCWKLEKENIENAVTYYT